jgi:hypothetical protein
MPVTRRLWARRLVSGVAFVVLAAGCSDSGPNDTAAPTATSTSAVGASTTSQPSATSTPPRPTRRVTESTGFTSPTGNISCYIDPRRVRCDIVERDWQPPPRPADCDLDFGQGISLSAGGSPRFVCAGDTARNREPAIPYGESIAAGSLRCDSAESGMSCNDLDTGRGFTLSRQDYSFR